MELGVGHGDRVAVVAGNECGFVVSLLAIWARGGIAVLPNTRNAPEQVLHVVATSGATVTLLGREHAALRARIGELQHVAMLDDLRAATAGGGARIPVLPTDVAMQPYTSGSTGEPKGVLLDHAGQIHNAHMMALTSLMVKEDVCVVSGPAFHANALAGLILPALVTGGAVIFLPRFDPHDLARTVAVRRATATTFVPAMLRMLLDSGAVEQYDMSSLRLLACGSAPVTAELLALAERAMPGAAVIEGYGLTEGGPVITKNPLFGPRKLGTIGLPLPGVDVRLMAEGVEVTSGSQVGELQVRGPGVMQGYFENESATRWRLLPGGWLRTGDLAWRDADGYYTFAGRHDDMMNVGGENVYPAEVEARIRQLSTVADVVVVPAPHPVKGQVPMAFVVPRAGSLLTESDVQHHCLKLGPAYAHPRRVVMVHALPLASTGKVDRTQLSRQALDMFNNVP